MSFRFLLSVIILIFLAFVSYWKYSSLIFFRYDDKDKLTKEAPQEKQNYIISLKHNMQINKDETIDFDSTLFNQHFDYLLESKIPHLKYTIKELCKEMALKNNNNENLYILYYFIVHDLIAYVFLVKLILGSPYFGCLYLIGRIGQLMLDAKLLVNSYDPGKMYGSNYFIIFKNIIENIREEHILRNFNQKNSENYNIRAFNGNILLFVLEVILLLNVVCSCVNCKRKSHPPKIDRTKEITYETQEIKRTNSN